MLTACSLRLLATAEVILVLTADVVQQQAQWKPSANEWSIAEVLGHLLDEERFDFPFRLRSTLEQPDVPLPAIDPEGWVIAHRYNTRDLTELRAEFVAERKRSLDWLKQLQQPNWDTPVNHPHLQGLRAGDLLHAWVGHDLLHIRQINELRWKWQEQMALPYRLEYAGDW
ncbi:MAG: DinB family protein [Roseiflexaceae bacterium]